MNKKIWEVGDILTPLSPRVSCQFPKGERFIVTKVDGEKFHVSQFGADHHGYWWKEHEGDQQFMAWANPKSVELSPAQIEDVIASIENCQVLIPIDRFFNEDGTHITKKEYGQIVIETLCEELRAKYQ